MARTKTVQVALRLTPSEKENLSTQAAKARMSMSQYLLALSEQKKIIVAEGLPELCVQLIKIQTTKVTYSVIFFLQMRYRRQ